MLLEALRQVPLFNHLSEEQRQCLTEGTEIWLEANTIIAKQGDPPDGFYIILSGQTESTRNVEGENVPAVILRAGEVFAELILLLDEPYPTTGRSITPVHLYKLSPDQFWNLLSVCPTLMRSLLKIAAERSQIYESVTQQQAKLISLGTLSAGLAHELNNPAAATQGNVQQLETILQKLPNLALQLHQQPLEPAQLQFLTEFYQQANIQSNQAIRLDPLAQSEREDEIADWLADRHIAQSWTIAPVFVSAGLMIDRLNELTAQVAPPCLASVIAWLEATLSGEKLLSEIKQSTTRISELIQAMKDYSYLDQAPIQEIDLHEGIESTLTILKHKLKYGITIDRQYETLPRIEAHGRELNQVWTNLIDNAIDAMQGKGTLTIRTQADLETVTIEIIDTGTGIDQAVRSRIFEPFFTTKGVGAGTGLGLDVARRIIVQQHQGEINLDSQPGQTRFVVHLPIRLTAGTS